MNLWISKFQIFADIFFRNINGIKQAGAELGQAQIRLDDIVEVVIEVVKEATGGQMAHSKSK